MMTENITIYFNDKGEVTDQPIQLQQEGCDGIIDFCGVSTVPDGFTFEFSLQSFSLCVDASDLVCMLENKEVEATISNPCGGQLTCPVTIDAVRALGCVKVHINVGRLVPIQPFGPGLNFGCNCTLCFDQIVCVNQVIGYICGLESCVEDCYRFGGGSIFLNFGTDECGRQTVIINGRFSITLAGC